MIPEVLGNAADEGRKVRTGIGGQIGFVEPAQTFAVQNPPQMPETKRSGRDGRHDIFAVDQPIGAHPQLLIVLIRKRLAARARHTERVDGVDASRQFGTDPLRDQCRERAAQAVPGDENLAARRNASFEQLLQFGPDNAGCDFAVPVASRCASKSEIQLASESGSVPANATITDIGWLATKQWVLATGSTVFDSRTTTPPSTRSRPNNFRMPLILSGSSVS